MGNHVLRLKYKNNRLQFKLSKIKPDIEMLCTECINIDTKSINNSFPETDLNIFFIQSKIIFLFLQNRN